MVEDESLKNSNGRYYELEVSPLVNAPDFEGLSQYPNASKYLIKNPEGGYIIYEDENYLEEIIIALKKIHGLKDPWDDDPNYLKKQQ